MPRHSMAVGLLEETIRIQEERATRKERETKRLDTGTELGRVTAENNKSLASTSRWIAKELRLSVAKLKGQEYG